MPLFRGSLQRLEAWLAQSIAHRVRFVVAGLSASFVLLIGLLAYATTQFMMRQSLHAEMQSEAVLVEARLAQILGATARGIDQLAHTSLVANALVDSAGRSAYLEPFLREYQLAEDVDFSLAMTDHSGRLIAGNRPDVILPKTSVWIREQIEKNSAYAEVLLEEPAQLLLAYPVIFPGTSTPEGMLLLMLPLAPVMQQAIGNLPVRNVVLQENQSAQRRHLHGRSQASELRVDKLLSLPVPLDQLRLSVSIERTWLDIYRPLLLLGTVYALAALLAVWLAVWLAKLATSRVVAPLLALTEAAHRNIDEAQAMQDFPVTGRDEVGQLGQALQHLVEQLRKEQALLEQRVAERTTELRDLSYIVRRTNNGVVVTDAQGLTEWVNEGFVRLSGYTLDELYGRKPGDLLQGPQTDPAAVELMHQHLASGEEFSIDIVNYHKNGKPYWINIDVQPIFDAQGQVEKFVALETDVTERKRVEQLKSEFVSVVSHELRTPLTAIRGALGLLKGGVTGTLPPAAHGLVEMALSNSERLTRLINDLLDIQKLESGKMEFHITACVLPELMADALASNQLYAQKYGVQIVIEGAVPEVTLQLDMDRFQQIMANFLSNAAKFSPAGQTVRMAAALHGNGRVRISVSDQGPGIPQEFQSRVFQKFSQADASSTRAKDGTGLGLSITKALVEGMGGQIGFDSQPDAGTSFWMSFPVSSAQ